MESTTVQLLLQSEDEDIITPCFAMCNLYILKKSLHTWRITFIKLADIIFFIFLHEDNILEYIDTHYFGGL